MKEGILMNDFLTIFYPVLYTFLVGFLGYIGKQVVKLVPKIIDYVVAKIGLTNYQKSKLVALDIWNAIEEHFRVNGIIEDTVQAKITMFESLIKQKIPAITDKDIELVRQAIAGEINKDKPLILKTIEQPIEIGVPIKKYFAEDGVTELQPVINTAQ
jgi:hypothetical protein